MKAKLTLSIDREKNKTISETPITNVLTGVLKGKITGKPYKELRDDMLKEKYGL